MTKIGEEYKIDITPPEGRGYSVSSVSRKGPSGAEITRLSIQVGKPRRVFREVDLDFVPRNIADDTARLVLTREGKEVGSLLVGELKEAIAKGNGSILQEFIADTLNNKPEAKKPFSVYADHKFEVKLKSRDHFPGLRPLPDRGTLQAQQQFDVMPTEKRRAEVDNTWAHAEEIRRIEDRIKPKSK